MCSPIVFLGDGVVAEGSAFGLQLNTMSTGETLELIDVVRKGREAKPCVGGTLTQYSLS